jgi:hypothetical protein
MNVLVAASVAGGDRTEVGFTAACDAGNIALSLERA